MSLISTFYLGPAADVARAIRERPATATTEFPSSDLSVSILERGGLTVDQIEAACAALGELRGARDSTVSVGAGDILDGDGDERQVVRITPAFVAAFASLTDAEAEQLSRRLLERELADAREFNDRRRRMALRPFQSRLDYAAFVLVAAFAWLESRSFLVTLAVTGAFALLAFFVLPRWRLRKISAPRAPDADFRPALLRIAEICRTAARARQDLVYEWSL
jgi:hypothetical protein